MRVDAQFAIPVPDVGSPTQSDAQFLCSPRRAAALDQVRRGKARYRTVLEIRAEHCKIECITPIAAEAQPCIPSRQKSADYFPALTGVRFFLSLWVIVHHLVSPGMMLENWARGLVAPVHGLLDSGYLAVQTFFVLSGFVLALCYSGTTWTARNVITFGMARVARIYPVYLLSLLIISYYILRFLSLAHVEWPVKFSRLFTYAAVLQGWLRDPDIGWNTPAWTLSCELFFYVFLPVLLFCLRDRKWWKLTLAFVVAQILPEVLYRAGMPHQWKPPLNLADFLAGIAAAYLYLAVRGRLANKGPRLYLPAAALGLFFIVSPHTLDRIAVLSTILRPLNALLLVGLALSGGVVSRILSTTAAQYLGKISYAMYILHVPVLWWFGNLGPEQMRGLQSAVAVIYISTVIGTSAIAFKYVEVPANRWIRSWVKAI